MSDFLSNLAARSLGKAETVRPRLASMFEADFATGIRSAHVANRDELEENIAHEKSEPEKTARPQLISKETIAASKESVSTRSDQRQQSGSNRRSPVVSNGASSLLFEQTKESGAFQRDEPPARIEPQTQARNDMTGQEQSIHKSREPVADLSVINARAAAGDEFEAKPATTAPVNQAINRDVAEAREPVIESQSHQPAVEPVVERTIIERIIERMEPAAQSVTPLETNATEIEHDEVSFSIVAQPRVRPYAKAEPRAIHEMETATRSKQTVNVTIGRIEVRAMVSRDLRKEKNKEQSPVMSLDEYLRQRQR